MKEKISISQIKQTKISGQKLVYMSVTDYTSAKWAELAGIDVAVVGDSGSRYGIQFHPEVVHTPQGRKIVENFLYKVCGLKGRWTPENFVSRAIDDIRRKVGHGNVICALSGGVDSAVAATLVHKAVGNQLTCVFVYEDATEDFLSALEGVTDPEHKRKLVGEEFIKVFERGAEKVGHADFLCQGTLYPDVIESKTDDSKVSAKIKTHHNVGGLPQHMKLKLVEPLRYLFKDEVREVGIELGLPEEMVYRQPFPGPGLAIRVLGDVRCGRALLC